MDLQLISSGVGSGSSMSYRIIISGSFTHQQAIWMHKLLDCTSCEFVPGLLTLTRTYVKVDNELWWINVWDTLRKLRRARIPVQEVRCASISNKFPLSCNLVINVASAPPLAHEDLWHLVMEQLPHAHRYWITVIPYLRNYYCGTSVAATIGTYLGVSAR